MGAYLIKFADNEYVEWSEVVDAPVTHVMDREEAVAYCRAPNSRSPGSSRVDAEARVARADENGHSAFYMPPRSAEELIAANRAGDGEKTLTLNQIRKKYRTE